MQPPSVSAQLLSNARTAAPADSHNGLRAAFIGVGAFSCFINLLTLTGPFFMLEVYDRVLPSRSLQTLFAFLLLAVGLYAVLGLLEVIRSRMMTRIAGLIDTSLSSKVIAVIVGAPLKTKPRSDVLRPAQDLDQIRSFLSGQGPVALFDLPWMPIFIAICFLLHPLIGWLTAVAMALLISLTVLTDLKTRGLTKKAAAAVARRNLYGEAAHRAAESIAAMGMAKSVTGKWDQVHTSYATLQGRAADIGGTLSGASKSLRYTLQSMALGLGAYLAILDEISVGMIVAASIIVSRAVAPIEQVIGNWRSMLAAWQAWQRLKEMLSLVPSEPSKTSLPAPKKLLSVEGVFASPPGERRPTIKNVTFHAKVGSVVGVLGPSASGKSSLVRAIVGVWPAIKGQIRLDGASLDQWSASELGRHIGYMPQIVDLFPGTIAENIARLNPEADSSAVITAAVAAGVHEMIVALPGGYGFQVSDNGANLSAGQRQRIALARALYGDPFLVVLDEPNSNLDLDGDGALAQAIASIRGRGGITIVVTHRRSVLSLLDSVLVMENGMARAFGPRDTVLGWLEQQRQMPPRPSQVAVLATVGGEGT